jgi:hypothetical protein
MTEAITTAVRAKTAKPSVSMNATLNYALVAVALLGALAMTLAILVW